MSYTIPQIPTELTDAPDSALLEIHRDGEAQAERIQKVNLLYTQPGVTVSAVAPPAPPADLAALQALGDLGQTDAWEEGQYIVLGDASEAHWDGDSWEEGKTPSPYLVHDTFTDVNGTMIENHTPDVDQVGGGWIRNDNNDHQIIDNMVRPNVVASQGPRIEAGISDCIITADIVESVGACCILPRDNSTGLFSPAWRCLYNGTTLKVYEADTLRASTAFSTALPAEMKATVNGQTIINEMGGETAQYDLASQAETETRHGLSMSDTGNRMDNFKVMPL